MDVKAAIQEDTGKSPMTENMFLEAANIVINSYLRAKRKIRRSRVKQEEGLIFIEWRNGSTSAASWEEIRYIWNCGLAVIDAHSRLKWYWASLVSVGLGLAEQVGITTEW